MTTPSFQHRLLPRRKFLGQAAGMMAAGSTIVSNSLGCRRPMETPAVATKDSPSAPLRIAALGRQDELEPLRRCWSAVSEQPLDISLTPLHRDQPIDPTAFLQSTSRCDVIVYPMALMGEALSGEFVTDFSDVDMEMLRQTAGDLSVSIRNAIRFAGRDFAAPLGARQPVLLSSLNAERFENWSQYDQWIGTQASGVAAEPLAPGWAAAMFFWRAASTNQGTWLFGNEDLEPVIEDESYVEILDQMKRVSKHYTSERLSPEQIWKRLSEGALKAAIGFPFGPVNDGLSLSDLPAKQEPGRVLLDLFTPVVSISRGCRQSAAAKKFIAWLCGGDGSETLRRQVPTMTITRSPLLSIDSRSDDQQDGSYDAWLRNRLKTSATLPSIQIDSALEYYQVLDEHIGRCLDGKSKPSEALGETAKQWQAITERVGVESQMRQWRRCRGMRA